MCYVSYVSVVLVFGKICVRNKWMIFNLKSQRLKIPETVTWSLVPLTMKFKLSAFEIINFKQVKWPSLAAKCAKIINIGTSFNKKKWKKIHSTVIMQKGESQNGVNKKAKHAKFSEKRKFLTSWYAHAIRSIKNKKLTYWEQ